MVRGSESRDEVGPVQFSPGPVRSVKSGNAENQRARIAPGLDRHWIGWPGLVGGIDCQRADGSFGDANRPIIDGGTWVCHAATFLLWGEVRFRRPSKAGNFVWGSGDWGEAGLVLPGSVHPRLGLSAFVWPTHPVGGVWRCRGLRGGWIGLVIDQIVIPGAAERRPGIHGPLKEAGFPPSRE